MSEEKVRACWCAYDGTALCETCQRKVYYPDDPNPYADEGEDEQDCYPA